MAVLSSCTASFVAGSTLWASLNILDASGTFWAEVAEWAVSASVENDAWELTSWAALSAIFVLEHFVLSREVGHGLVLELNSVDLIAGEECCNDSECDLS